MAKLGQRRARAKFVQLQICRINGSWVLAALDARGEVWMRDPSDGRWWPVGTKRKPKRL
jgi:hypothetical protein